jgi:hypothetical protein
LLLSSQTPIEQTEKWLLDVVIGLNLCPFAAKPYKKEQIHIAQRNATTEESLLEDILVEMQQLNSISAAERDTTLVVIPHMLNDFWDYNMFLDWVESLIKQQQWEGVFQIASFHPEYCFHGAHQEDNENLTNRSPFPTIHIIREASMERVLKLFKDPESIPETNMDTVSELTDQQKQALFPYLFTEK